MTVFVRAFEDQDKAGSLLHALSDSEERFVIPVSSFHALPGSPFAYWAPVSLLSLMAEGRRFDPACGRVLVGLQTDDDFRFVRLWLELGGRSSGWAPILKGDTASSFYADIPTVLHWQDEARQMKAHITAVLKGGHWSRHVFNIDSFFEPGVSWALRTARFAPSVVPTGCIPTVSRYLAVTTRTSPLVFVGLWNSTLFDALCKLRMERIGHPKFIVGVIKGLPAEVPKDTGRMLTSLAMRGWSLKRALDTRTEVSHAFVVPAVLQVEGGSFGERVVAWAEKVASTERELESVQAGIDEICFDLYEIPEEDRRAITEGFEITDDSSDDVDETDDGDEDSDVELDPEGLAAGLVSWCVAVATGRFDVRLATGDRAWPEEPDPFDPLPVCSPAMLTGDDGLPLTEPPAGYPLEPTPVLVNDPGHRLDVTARVREVFEIVFGDDADAWWTEVGEVLDRRGEVGSWLSKGFFGHHLKTYSKSRRKAPILWPIGTASGSYQVWLYAHRVTSDSLFRVLNDLIVPKLNTEESRLTRLRQEAGPNPSASERKATDAQEKFVSELVELRETIEQLAPLWAPDLNDGIVIVLAPFWRLFAHHKPWMRELKKHWGKLANGDYDWAQLAMHLWPERVIPKCAEDRSLAIAHNLENVFWQPDTDNDDKWIRRDTPTTPIDQLIDQRHNPTTTTALTRMEPA